MGTMLRCKAPLRISFAGGGTDVSPYPERHGGAVLNCTIDKYSYVTLSERESRTGISVTSLDYNISVDYQRPSDLSYNRELDLVKATIKTLGRMEGLEGKMEGLDLYLHSDAPPGTGLGTSSAMAVALIGAFQRYFGEPWTPYEVAELAFRIEREELAQKGGRQDQYSAAFGGINFMEFTGTSTIVNPLRIPQDTMNELAYRLLLCYTGTGHYSHDIIERQQGNYVGGRTETVQALDATKALAVQMKNQLLRGNLDEMGRLLHDGWELKKRFTEGITTPQIDAMYGQARGAGALGGKLVGSGGGGYLLLFCDFDRRRSVAESVQAAGGKVVEFALDPHGVQSWRVRK